MPFIRISESALRQEAKKNLLSMQNGDVVFTHADVEVVKREVGFEPNTSLISGIARWTD
jgi:UDP-glucuronate 4-epimerase